MSLYVLSNPDCSVCPRFFHVASINARRDFQRAPMIMTLLPAPTLKGLRRAVKVLGALTPYLPAGLLARLASSPQGMVQEGEHRLVAVMFALSIGARLIGGTRKTT